MNSNFWRAGAIIALLIVAPAPAHAQNWPTRAVKFIVPFGPGAGGRDPILALGASCFQLVFGFLVFAGLFTLLLPTTFPRALLVTVFFYLEYIALIILVVIAVFVFFAAAGGGGGFK